jgi:SAM-dependent methyltransferase
MKYVKINKGFRALDIGGGPYGIINFMNFKERHMLDPLADYYHDNYNFAHDIRLLQGKVEKMVYDDEYFDIIFCTNVLDHVQSITTAVGEIARVARRGGFLVLSVDCCAFLRRNARISLERLGLGEAAHPHTLSTKDVRNLLKLHGLSLLYQNKGIGTLGEYVWSKCGELWEKQTTTRTLMKVTLQLPVFSKDQFIFIASKSGGDKRDDEKSLNRGASV